MTYKIRCDGYQEPPVPDFLSKEQILTRQLSKCFLKVGDKVKFKKPKKKPIYGIVIDIKDKVEETTWIQNGLVPYNIHVATEPNGIIVKTSVKKLTFIGRN